MNARTMPTIEAKRSLVEKFNTDYETVQNYLVMMNLNKASITQDEFDAVVAEMAFSHYCGQNDC